MNKFVQDTIMIKGKYSMKRVIVAITLPYTMILGAYIVISDKWLGLKTVNIYAIQVFTGMLGFITAIVITSAYAKKAELKYNDAPKEENTNTEVIG